MFFGASLFNTDISNWDVSRVTNMEDMFYSAKSFDNDISKWKVLIVTNIRFMFQNTYTFNQGISNWDVSSVTNMTCMFKGAKSFAQTLCGAWRTSVALKVDMFAQSIAQSIFFLPRPCALTRLPLTLPLTLSLSVVLVVVPSTLFVLDPLALVVTVASCRCP